VTTPNRSLPTRTAAAGALLLTAACGGERSAPPSADTTAAAVAAAPAAADSLVASRGGVELWFTLAREARDSAGRSCVERGVEIRRDGRRIPVPLFYTTEAPRFVADTVAEAHLSNECRPGPLYGINLNTGQPIPPKQPARR
jgi:hypothetical protein